MAKRVLILQTDPKAGRILSDYFARHGDQVWKAASLDDCLNLAKEVKPSLVFVDLHLPANDLKKVLAFLRKELPEAGVIVTNRHPDFRRELVAKEAGIHVFLRQPFTPDWIASAIKQLEKGGRKRVAYLNARDAIPSVRVPMRFKITFPYVLLALLFALASSLLVSRYVTESILARFTAQLIDAGKLSADWMVHEEDRCLTVLRLIANTQGLAESIRDGNTELIRQIVFPIALNSQEEAVEILNMQGVSLLSLHYQKGGEWNDIQVTQGDTSLSALEFVQSVINHQIDPRGDKYAGLARVPWGDYLYVAGPIKDGNDQVVGVVLVGKSLLSLAQEIRQTTLGHISIYALDGSLLASTLTGGDLQPLSDDLVQKILTRQDQESAIREFQVGSNKYSEILGPWEVRGGRDVGIMGASLAENFLVRPALVTRFQLSLIIALGLLSVVLLGIFLANQITNPLARVVQASIELARGNLEVKVPSRGNDEVAVLAHAFNYMVSGLQEGIIYRDLLGRTVSPQVREALRRSFASGNLKLEGQHTEATVLMSDIRGFTTLAEREAPTTILTWLNEYFGELVPVINACGGVVDKFEGDAILAFFGILPTPIPAEKSAYQACQAAIKMLAVIEAINARRIGRGEPPLITGIGVNTGSLIAGGLGTSDRLDYTVIGDTVNTTARIQGLTRAFGESGIVVSESTLVALGDKRGEFNLEPLGEHALKGKMELLWLYRLRPADPQASLAVHLAETQPINPAQEIRS